MICCVRFSRAYSVTAILLFLLVAPAQAAEFELRDGDRVVLIGDGLIEQEQYFGWLEVALTTAFPDNHVTFRNLGWSADTPVGDSRLGLSLVQAGREADDEGWRQLVKQLELTQPSVLIVGYGMASSLENGVEGASNFGTQLQKLVEASQKISPDIRLLFLSPIAHLNASDDRRDALAAHRKQVHEIAMRAQAPYVDLSTIAASKDLRKDPIHLNSTGYRALASSIVEELGLPDSQWESSPHTESLRQVILRKNEWWFHRSRPANMAYVFGFRKHEQGQNAAEIPQFDALVESEEERIAALRSLKPVSLQANPKQLESQFAEFTEQPVPEFVVGEGLEVQLWAQNPDLNKPIHMNFDPQGRLWVASSEAYPMIEVGQTAPDKIIVLEDTNNDGRADKSQVFAEGLLIPTGIAPGNGGVYVAQSTDLLFLKDTDGDGKADEKTRVLSGFGTEDTHHNLHTLRWGPDGRLYMNQSVYTRTDAETPHGVVRLRAGGGFRYDTQRMQMEVFFRGLWNSWGHQFDAFGQSFLTDGAGFAGVAYSFPGATFNPTPGASKPLDLISPGNWPKFASLEIIGGDAFPPEWDGSLITCDFRANRVTRFSLQEQKAGFVTEQQEDLLRTSAPTFRPIDVKLGPDGALYIADWSNPIINHGEVDFRDARRDRWHGRIWRVTWKKSRKQTNENLTQKTTQELLDLVVDPSPYLSRQAARVLTEQRDATAHAFPKWLASQSTEVERLRGLWLAQSLDLPARPLLDELLKAEDHRVRAAATRVAAAWTGNSAPDAVRLNDADALAALSQQAHDSHPRVRLEAVRGLARLGSAEGGLAALAILRQPMDRFLEHALRLTIDELSEPLLQSLKQEQWEASEVGEQSLEFFLTAIEPNDASQYLSKRLAREPLPADGKGPWIGLIASAGGNTELDLLFNELIGSKFDSTGSKKALGALIRAQRLRKRRPTTELHRISHLLDAEDSEVRALAIELAGTWKLRNQVDNLRRLANEDRVNAARFAAINALRSIGGPQALAALEAIANSEQKNDTRLAAVAALSTLDPNRASRPFLSMLRATETEEQALSSWRAVLNARGVGKVVAPQIAASGLSEFQLLAGLRAARDGGRNEPELLAALEPLASSQAMFELNAEFIARLAKQSENANPHRGEQIYRRPELACVTCHAIGGVGGRVGPDMTSLGASAPVDYIIESLFDPNAKIKEGFHSVVIITEDDQVVTGVETDSTEEELVLRNAENQTIRIPTIDVVAKRNGPSLMPTGVMERLSDQERADLVSFLTRLGKPGEFDASQGGVARKFELFAGTHRIEQQGAERIIRGKISDGWKPALTRVNGDLPRSVMQELTKQPINIALVHVYAKARIEVASDRIVKLRFPTQATCWIDAEKVGDGGNLAVELTAGIHEVLLRLDARALPEALRLESTDVTFLAE